MPPQLPLLDERRSGQLEPGSETLQSNFTWGYASRSGAVRPTPAKPRCDGEMGLADAGRAQQQKRGAVGDPTACGELAHLRPRKPRRSGSDPFDAPSLRR